MLTETRRTPELRRCKRCAAEFVHELRYGGCPMCGAAVERAPTTPAPMILRAEKALQPKAGHEAVHAVRLYLPMVGVEEPASYPEVRTERSLLARMVLPDEIKTGDLILPRTVLRDALARWQSREVVNRAERVVVIQGALGRMVSNARFKGDLLEMRWPVRRVPELQEMVERRGLSHLLLRLCPLQLTGKRMDACDLTALLLVTSAQVATGPVLWQDDARSQVAQSYAVQHG